MHGRIPPTALFALPLAYCYPLQFGFVNFALSMALALNAVRAVAAARRGWAAAAARGVFVPLSCVLWVCHTFGWGVLGVLAFSAEMIRQHDRARTRVAGRGQLDQGVGARRARLPAARAADAADGRLAHGRPRHRADRATGSTGAPSIGWLTMILRDRWLAFDIAIRA